VSLFVFEDLNSQSYGEVEEKAEQRFNLIVGSSFEVIVSVGVHVDGNVVEDHFFASLKKFHHAEDAAEAKGPKRDENVPEIILNRSGVLHPKDENVFRNDDEVQKN
jgi:hypothetical protein